MEELQNQSQSIFGKWWLPIRIWFYPAWLLYELSIRFYGYALDIYHYIFKNLEFIFPDINLTLTQITAGSFAFIAFAICFVYLTVPACYILFLFFKRGNLTKSKFELKLKKNL